jgi:hypothetical protein
MTVLSQQEKAKQGHSNGEDEDHRQSVGSHRTVRGARAIDRFVDHQKRAVVAVEFLTGEGVEYRHAYLRQQQAVDKEHSGQQHLPCLTAQHFLPYNDAGKVEHRDYKSIH